MENDVDVVGRGVVVSEERREDDEVWWGVLLCEDERLLCV